MSFWIIVAGLIVLALLLLILPILRQPRDAGTTDRQQQNIAIAREKKELLNQQLELGELTQAEYDGTLQDLETSLALDIERSERTTESHPGKWAVWALVVAVPVMSVSLYLKLGEYRVIENPKLVEARQRTTEANVENMSMEAMIERVKQRLRDNPEDAQGWFILGRTLLSMQQIDEAITAFQRTLDLVGDEPGVLFTLADALAVKNNGSMAGEPEILVSRGLGISPMDPTGLWLAGLAAEQSKQYKLAYANWSKMLPLIAEDLESSKEVKRLLGILEKRDPSIDPISSPEIAVASASISLSVDLDASLLGKTTPEDIVFVYAKAMQGPPMPLAVKRLRVADLPARVSLSDNDAMIASMKLSSFDQVIIGARVSKSGNPVGQPGDLFVEVESVSSKNPPAGLALTINQIK